MAINNPNYRKLPSDQPQVSNGFFPLGPNAPRGAFSTDAHENLIRGAGFKVKHYRYALNPNRTSIEGGVDVGADINRKSFNYYDPHDLFITTQELSWTDTYMQQGIYGNFQVAAVLYRSTYEDVPNLRTFLRANDILALENDITVMTQQLVEYNGRIHTKLMFPVVEVDYLADANNRYYQGTDFTICNNMIEWLPEGLKPKFLNGKGQILSAVYWTKPYFQVVGTPRCFRALYTNPTGNANQPVNLTYFPGNAIVKMLWTTDIDFDLPGWDTSMVPQQGMNIK